MENTIQIYAPTVEGEFATQNFSFSQFYNRLKDQEATTPLQRGNDDGPDYGLLSRCLAPSPVVHTLLSASIRCGTAERDVIFVGERHIELRSLNERLSLEPIAAKSDFFCKIRSAAAIDIKKESEQTILDRIIKREDDDKLSYSAGGDGASKGQFALLPKQMLVLALDTGDLAFVYVKLNKSGKLEFVVSTHKISPERPKVYHVGKAIAVELYSRAMTVCAWEGSFKLYSIQNPDSLQYTLQRGNPVIPIEKERTFNVPGTIIDITFLRPNEQGLVFWIVIFANRLKQIRILLYEWDTTRPLTTAFQHGKDGFCLREAWGVPLHVVPLSLPTYFVLIFEFNIIVAKAADITSGNQKWKTFAIPMSGSSAKGKLITAWARPHRNASYAQRNDDFYVVKEDGELFWIYVGERTYDVNIESVQAGQFRGTAGAALVFHEHEYPTSMSNDLLIAAGEGSVGGTYLITPKSPRKPDGITCIQEIFNWSPVFDMDIYSLKNAPGGRLSSSRGRVYSSTGFGSHGAIGEIRYGIEAQVNCIISLGTSISKLYPLQGKHGNGSFVLCSHLIGTSLLFLKYDGTDGTDLEDVGEKFTLRSGDNVTTVAAAMISGRAVQITSEGIVATILDEREVSLTIQSPQPCQKWACSSGSEISVATVLKNLIVVVLKTGDKFSALTFTVLSSSGGDQDQFLEESGTPIKLDSEPTYIELLQIGKHICLFIENGRGLLSLFEGDEQGTFKFKGLISDGYGEDLSTNTQTESPVCESTCLLESEGKTYLLMGLRNGYVLYGEIDVESLSFSLLGNKRLGRLPVILHIKEGQSERVVAKSTFELYQLTIKSSSLIVSPIIFNISDDPLFDTVCHLDYDFMSTGFIDPVLGAAGSDLIVATLSRRPMIVARQLRFNETPTRVLYYEPENLLLAACLRPRVPGRGPGGFGDFKGSPSSTIQFLDPKTGENLAPRDIKDAKYNEIIFNRPDEMIHCMCNWKFLGESSSYSCVLVGTSFQSEDIRKGRIHILSIRSVGMEGNRRIEVRKRNQINCNEPVYSIAPFNESSIVFGSANALSKIDLVTTTPGKWKFDNLATVSVPSTPLQITVQEKESLIWISSVREILSVHKYIPESNTIQRVYSDDRDRAGRSHVQIEEDFFLAADRDEGIIGLWKPSDPRSTTNLIKVFEGCLPNSVTSLRSGNLRAPWNPRKSDIPGVIRPDKDIIGTCFDGSIYQFTVLSAAATDLLSGLQRAYLSVAYSSGRSIPMHRREERIVKEGNLKHVNGDVFAEVIAPGNDLRWVEQLFKQDDESVVMLLEQVFGEKVHAAASGGRGAEGIKELLAEWIKDLLDSIML